MCGSEGPIGGLATHRGREEPTSQGADPEGNVLLHVPLQNRRATEILDSNGHPRGTGVHPNGIPNHNEKGLERTQRRNTDWMHWVTRGRDHHLYCDCNHAFEYAMEPQQFSKQPWSLLPCVCGFTSAGGCSGTSTVSAHHPTTDHGHYTQGYPFTAPASNHYTCPGGNQALPMEGPSPGCPYHHPPADWPAAAVPLTASHGWRHELFLKGLNCPYLIYDPDTDPAPGDRAGSATDDTKLPPHGPGPPPRRGRPSKPSGSPRRRQQHPGASQETGVTNRIRSSQLWVLSVKGFGPATAGPVCPVICELLTVFPLPDMASQNGAQRLVTPRPRLKKGGVPSANGAKSGSAPRPSSKKGGVPSAHGAKTGPAPRADEAGRRLTGNDRESCTWIMATGGRMPESSAVAGWPAALSAAEWREELARLGQMLTQAHLEAVECWTATIGSRAVGRRTPSPIPRSVAGSRGAPGSPADEDATQQGADVSPARAASPDVIIEYPETEAGDYAEESEELAPVGEAQTEGADAERGATVSPAAPAIGPDDPEEGPEPQAPPAIAPASPEPEQLLWWEESTVPQAVREGIRASLRKPKVYQSLQYTATSQKPLPSRTAQELQAELQYLNQEKARLAKERREAQYLQHIAEQEARNQQSRWEKEQLRFAEEVENREREEEAIKHQIEVTAALNHAAKIHARRSRKAAEQPRRQGCVLSFKEDKGWGFIADAESNQTDIFVSRRDVEAYLPEGHPARTLIPGERVSFIKMDSVRGPYAIRVSRIEKDRYPKQE